MAWTVPNGCYYMAMSYGLSTKKYYNAGTSVPAGQAPQDMVYRDGSYCYFVLADFTNGYVYTNIGLTTITISGATFTVTANSIRAYRATRVIASDYGLQESGITLSGDAFTFGNGSGLKDKFTTDEFSYSLYGTFTNRTDITAATIPNGVDDLRFTFAGCTSLTSVTGTLTNLLTAYRAFRNCALLTTIPTFSSMSAETDWNKYNINNSMFKSFESCFEGCAALATTPTLPAGVLSMSNCFNGCTSLTTPPTIPNTATNLNWCFNNCTALTTAPTIPSSVTQMKYTFCGCSSLVTAPTIPGNISGSVEGCFMDCSALAGSVTINASPNNTTDMFTGTVNDILLFGDGNITDIAQGYANVYIWTLSATIAASRNETTPTTVDVSVDVTWYKTGNISSLYLYRDAGLTPLSVTWDDPTLTISSIPTTFTTSLTSISESDTFTLSVVATDSYGSSAKVSVKIPIAFFTMDVQAGGKEIAFGAIANDNLAGYPYGFFKCEMDIGGRGFLDYIYPVGSYYETSDTTFDPNVTWGGTWVLETEGQVHVSAGANYVVDGAPTDTNDGGAETVTLDVTQMPSHSHGLQMRYNNGTGSVYGVDTPSSPFKYTWAAGRIESTGGGQAHENMPPYIIVNRWHRTA